MKSFKWTLVFIFILAYAFILSGCASTPYVHQKLRLVCEPNNDHRFSIQNELTDLQIIGSKCAMFESDYILKELK